MQDSENFPDDIPVDIPVDDAVEQHRAINEPVLDEEDTAEPRPNCRSRRRAPTGRNNLKPSTSTPKRTWMSDPDADISYPDHTNSGEVLAPVGGETLSG